jgi:hypothetical protein
MKARTIIDGLFKEEEPEMAHACSVCKRVRQPDGSYKKQEIGHTNVSHGICPDCIPRFRKMGTMALRQVSESSDLYRLGPSGHLLSRGFSASAYEWRTITWLADRASRLARLNVDMRKWDWNGVVGLGTRQECLALAGAIERVVRGKPGNMIIRRQFTQGELQQFPADYSLDLIQKHYSTNVDRVWQFIEFLRTCEHGFGIQ